MRNKYPGICYRCQAPVAAGDGHFERFRGGWRTQHAACAIKHRLELAKAASAAEAEARR